MGRRFSHIVYLINQLPIPILHNKSPYEKLFLKLLDYKFLKVFGTTCWPHLRPYNHHKLDLRSLPCLFLGYGDSHKGYGASISLLAEFIFRVMSFLTKPFFPYLLPQLKIHLNLLFCQYWAHLPCLPLLTHIPSQPGPHNPLLFLLPLLLSLTHITHLTLHKPSPLGLIQHLDHYPLHLISTPHLYLLHSYPPLLFPLHFPPILYMILLCLLQLSPDLKPTPLVHVSTLMERYSGCHHVAISPIPPPFLRNQTPT